MYVDKYIDRNKYIDRYRYMKVKLLIAESSLTLCDPTDCSLPISSIHGRTLGEYVDEHQGMTSWWFRW